MPRSERELGSSPQLQRLLRRVDVAWSDLHASFAGLTDAQLMTPMTGTWSVRDVLAHITIWEEEALKHLPTIAAGRRPPVNGQ